MSSVPGGAAPRLMAQLFRNGTAAGLDDGDLLERFVSRRDEGAFAALVTRHGPMVLGVCNRLLRDSHDVDDAFQATFLILARRSGSIGRPHLLGNWLYGVARRVALRARAQAGRRRERERTGETAVDGAIAHDPHPGSADLRAVIDEELARLPESQRRPIVLCHLEGLTHEEAAARLSWPVGTVRSRMARGRETLRSRLVRRGVAPAALGTAATWPHLAPAALPPALVNATVRAAIAFAATSQTAVPTALTVGAATLARGAMSAMMMSKLKVVAAVVLISVGLAGGGGAMVAQQGVRGEVEQSGDPEFSGTSSTYPPGTSLKSLVERRDALEAEIERLRDQQSGLILMRQDIDRELDSRRGPERTTAPITAPTQASEATPSPGPSDQPPSQGNVLRGFVETYNPPERLVFVPADAALAPNIGDEVFVYQPKWETMTLMGSEGRPAVALRRPDHIILARAQVVEVQAGKAICTVTDMYRQQEDLRRGLEVVRVSDLATTQDGEFAVPDLASIPDAPDDERDPDTTQTSSTLNPLDREPATSENPTSTEPVQVLTQRLDALETELRTLRSRTAAPVGAAPGEFGGGFPGGVGGMGGGGFGGGFGGVGMGGMMRGGDQPGRTSYIQGDSVIVVQPEGQDRVFAYSLTKGNWYPQDLPESEQGMRVTPIVAGPLAAFAAGKHVFAFSASAGRWGGIELDAEGARPVVSKQTVLVEHAGSLHVFSADTGTWSSLDLANPTPPVGESEGPDPIPFDRDARAEPFGAEPRRPAILRNGPLVIATSAEGNRVTVTNVDTNASSTFEAPAGSTVIPVFQQNVIGLQISGDGIRQIAAYTSASGEWHVQDLPEPVETVTPSVSQDLVTYEVGHHLYVFSAKGEPHWRVFDVSDGEVLLTGPGGVEVRQGNQLHILNSFDGTWKTIEIPQP